MPSQAKESSAEPTYEYHGGAPPPKATDKIVQPAEEEAEVKDAVIHETVAEVEREEIQPVIERERIQTEVQQVVQPVLDVVTEAPTVEKVELQEEKHRYREKAKEADLERYQEQADAFKDEIHESAVIHEKVYKEPIIHETIKTKIITEVQPVIERVIHRTHVVEETKPIKETFIKAPVVHDQEIAPPISMEEFESLSKSPERTPTKIKSRVSLSPSPHDGDRPMTRLKRKKMAEATEGESGPAEVTELVDDGYVEVDQPSLKPSTIHGTVEKIVGAVEAGVGELIGNDGLVAKGQARKVEGELEIEAAQAAKKRKVDV
ncbi:hypothetical protein SpCBS45565_g02426 [Spizellomyces sp. 'palustris']|nr:hypothetical protein SpCBS45565_g02426 [Spizellomyces sp. 'palustris']